VIRELAIGAGDKTSKIMGFSGISDETFVKQHETRDPKSIPWGMKQ